MTRRTHAVVDSPLGPLTLVADDGTLCALHLDPPGEEAVGERDEPGLAAVADQLEEYFAGSRTTFDVPIAPAGTPFQRQVWDALREIPYGRTLAYGRFAELLGRPSAARAVGVANARNPIGIIVPCHRLTRANGDLVAYAGGLERKRRLLDFERGVRGWGP
jgi:methylated-DNA-[protein]-cysteine S-methyltransferase